ncbi:hypothetical protein GS597_10555 [Synechococcales cyanobacterium C]|uniref:Uncharacterized protein n=1 Tax=Petrachloros mirabilis ULC683 TaxID=2781853 RepID=A0A8K1ZZE9_9CYAN|nr:hypothetical protein [Petrachloros mirabilis]NCJ06942.1 hypothetical protein [Petrachloros mirabilis ULC683]
MSEIRDYGVTVEEYLAGLENGVDILELRRLEASGIPTHLALELMTITPKVCNGTATPEDLTRGLLILSPRGRKQLE